MWHYRLGYSFATKVLTILGKFVKICEKKKDLSADCYLKFESMKAESLVIADHNRAVNHLLS